MVMRVKKWYKLLILSSVISSTPVVLYLFSLQLSSLVLFLVMSSYAGLLLLLVESLILKLEVSNSELSTIYFSVPLSDIIEVEDGLFATKIRTRWRVYRLPPMENIHMIPSKTSKSRF
ncbi:hypothetical protein NA23_06345 [Fervidobacterium islandicum]|uniref:Uncharacterized protein n=1 Tax=Fervidobacterium islandicum TaxID=2423 RepID=A0AAI8CM65_FERIS|nr:hypothetical protein [Fervidobacterium islandicum]AMW32916.1 hypothetical protein NA23_06345 [Fervidobacterium islandicum]